MAVGRRAADLARERAGRAAAPARERAARGVAPARAAALALLGRQRRRGARARDLLRADEGVAVLDIRDRALATRLVLGVNACAGELDRCIDAHAAHPASLEPRVRDALRISAFELLFLETPRQVAVSQGVELVRSVRPKAAGMANAVLRRVAEGRPEVDAARRAVSAALEGPRAGAEGAGVSAVPGTAAAPPPDAGAGATPASAASAAADAGPSHDAPAPVRPVTTEDLRLVSGYPSWLVERLVSNMGLSAAAGLCSCALEAAPVYVCCCRPGEDAGQTEARLVRAGLEPERDGLTGSWALGSPAGLAGSGLVDGCEVAVADLAAQLVCRIAAPARGRVLEIGQGRGTKTLLLARVMGELGALSPALGASSAAASRGAVICGCELVASKVRVTSERLRVAGLSGLASATRLDARRLADVGAPELVGTFESVLLDAPCSGTGTMRRHPEIPWSLDECALDPSRPGSLPALQLEMLRAASTRVAVGGLLIYATCSVVDAENEGVVQAFLGTEEGREFERASVLEAPGVRALDGEGRALVSRWVSASGAFASAPVPGGHDGHYCVRLVRRR